MSKNESVEKQIQQLRSLILGKAGYSIRLTCEVRELEEVGSDETAEASSAATCQADPQFKELPWTGFEPSEVESSTPAIAELLQALNFELIEPHEISYQQAVEALTSILHKSLAYRVVQINLPDAQKLAKQFVDIFSPAGRYFTNINAKHYQEFIQRSSYSWTPFTSATFDAGVIGLRQNWIGILCVEDED